MTQLEFWGCWVAILLCAAIGAGIAGPLGAAAGAVIGLVIGVS